MSTISSELSYSQIQDLIANATAHGPFDWAAIFVPAFAAVAAVWIGYKAVDRVVQVKNEKVIENEVGILFDAVKSFFKYTDAIGLYFSMSEKYIENIIKSKPSDPDFDKKVKDATDAVYNKHSTIRKTSFLLRALDQKPVANKVDEYRARTIALRKMIIAELEEYQKNSNPQSLIGFFEYLKHERQALIKVRDECLDDLARCKHNLKTLNK